MLDIKWIRDNREEFENALSTRGIKIEIDDIIRLDEEKRQITTLLQEFQKAKNKK